MCDIYPLDNTRRRIMGIVVTDDEYSPSIVVKTYDDKPDDNADDDKCSVSRETVCQLMLMERTEPILPKYNKELQQSSSFINHRYKQVCRLIRIHHYFHFLPETLSQAVNIFDRVSPIIDPSIADLDLCSVTCLLLASKLHENYYKNLQQQQILVRYLKELYHRHPIKIVNDTESDIISMEKTILTSLDYRISAPSVYTFVYIFLDATESLIGVDIERDILLLVDTTLARYHLIQYAPSIIACGCIYIVRKMNGITPWSKALAKRTCYSETLVRPVARSILSTISLVENNIDLKFLDDDKYLNLKMSNICSLKM